MKKKLPSPSSRVISLDNAVNLSVALRRKGKKIVVTNGCFDILHRGHAEYLFNAASLGDALFVLLNSDASIRQLKGPSRPIINEEDRAYMLASLSFVDAVIIFNGERCTELFEKLAPDIYVKGGDYNIENINGEEKQALIKANSLIRFIPFIKDFSTTRIINKLSEKPTGQ